MAEEIAAPGGLHNDDIIANSWPLPGSPGNRSHASTWTACSQTCSKALLMFIVQSIFLFTCLIFALIQLTLTDSDNETERSVYISMISFIVGVWIPQPSFNQGKNLNSQ